jgi:Tfp pilus assembly protein PilX
MLFTCKKGSLIIALVFTVLLVVIGGVIANAFWGKAPLAVDMLKRAKAFNYAEAGLYEAFNRFRSGALNPRPLSATNTVVNIDGFNVTITVQPDGRVSSTVNVDNLKLY